MDIDAIQALPADCTTREVAQALGMAVRSVQLMVDRGELQAWKTPGGHRRIARASVLQWLQSRRPVRQQPLPPCQQQPPRLSPRQHRLLWQPLQHWPTLHRPHHHHARAPACC